MVCGSTNEVVFLRCTIFLLLLSGVWSFRCHSCTYTRSGDPTRDYECVNAVENVTNPIKLQCKTPNFCVTKTVYNSENQVSSLDRRCRAPDNLNCGEDCCDKSVYTTTCQHLCSTDLCNNEDKTWKKEVGGDAGSTFSPGPLITILFVLVGCFLF